MYRFLPTRWSREPGPPWRGSSVASIDASDLTDTKGRPQRLRTDAAYVYSAYLLRYLSVFILVPYYGRILGPATYGDVLAAMSLMALVWMTVNYGFSTTGTRDFALSGGAPDLPTIFAGQLSARCLLVPVGMVIGAVGTIASPALRANPWYGVIATLLGLINAYNLGWFYQGLRKFRLSLIFEAMIYPLNVVFVLLLVKTSNDGIQALLALLGSAAIAAFSAYAVAFRIVRPDFLSLGKGVTEIRAASTMFLQTVNSIIMTSGSTYILSVFSTPKQVGYFGSVEKLVSFALAFLQPAAQVLMPTIAHRTRHAPGDTGKLIRWGIVLEIAYGLCACTGGYALARYIIPIAFGANFVPSVPIMQIMVWALPFAALTHAIGCYLLIPQSKERWLVIAFIVGNSVNLALVAALAGALGGVGVSIARVGGEVITASILVYLTLRMRSARPRATP